MSDSPLQLTFEDTHFTMRAISPFREMGAYEALWCRPKTNFNSLSKHFAKYSGRLPSDFVTSNEAYQYAAKVKTHLENAGVSRFGVLVHGAGEYPTRLRDAKYPVELIYYQGCWELASSKSVAVVGTRKPSHSGILRTRNLVRKLVKDGFTIVSGLAAGIDRIAHETAIKENGRTIAVIGTPLSYCYPKENRELQRHISENYLVVSQVPVMRYEDQDYRSNRLFFLERNKTMSALTEATIIVEAGETSGTLVQAKAAIQQQRSLFILDSCFNNPDLKWPTKFAEKGAVRVKEYRDVRERLASTLHENRRINIT